MKGRKSIIIRYMIVIAVFLALTAALMVFFGSQEIVEYERPTLPVEVAKPEKRVINQSFETTGYVMAEAMIPVIPFVQGTIDEYYAKPGEYVEKGDVIAVIDKRAFELQRAQAEAQSSALDSAFARIEPLYRSGAVTKQEYESTRAQRDAAEAQLELADLQLSYATVTAPESGTIVMADSAAGSVASSSSPLAVIADLGSLVVDIAVGEKHYSQINEAENLYVEIERPATAFSEAAVTEAEIVSIAPYIDPVSKTFKVRVRLKDPSSFAIGMFVRARIIYDSVEDWTLGVSARLADGSVYVLSEDGTHAEHLVLSGSVSDARYFTVGEANKDKLFIVRGQNSVLDGEPVTVIER